MNTKNFKNLYNAACSWLTAEHLKTAVLCCLCLWLLGLVSCRAENRNREVADLRTRAEEAELKLDSLTARIQQQEDENLQAVIREELENRVMAQIIYGYEQAGAVTQAQKEVVACTVANRSEPSNALWPDDLLEVMQQPGQWQGYSDDNPVTQDNYEIACQVLDTFRRDGIRPIGPEFTYLYVDRQGVQARTEYLESANCRYIER